MPKDNVTPLFTCKCGKPGLKRAFFLTTESGSSDGSLVACDACFDETEDYLKHVRPIFDLMIEIGISREVANSTMSFMLAEVEIERRKNQYQAAAQSQQTRAGDLNQRRAIPLDINPLVRGERLIACGQRDVEDVPSK